MQINGKSTGTRTAEVPGFEYKRPIHYSRAATYKGAIKPYLARNYNRNSVKDYDGILEDRGRDNRIYIKQRL